MGNSSHKEPVGPRFQPVGPNFWSVRAGFKVFGFLSIGTHMSLIRLASGRFLLIDTVPLDDGIKQEFDALTENGELVDAVVATHPFHTLAFVPFYAQYPRLRYFGTPRHLRALPDVPWAGDVREHLADWAPEVEMRIPEGAEFAAPLPENFNHFSCVWVYCREARALHVDDTVNLYGKDMSFLLRLVGVTPNRFAFHPSIKGPGLHPTPEAPEQFAAWLQALIDEWDFDSVCCAHRGNMIGGAKAQLQQTLDEARPMLRKIAERNHRHVPASGPSSSSPSPSSSSSSSSPSSSTTTPTSSEVTVDPQTVEDCSKLNVKGNECG